jgi:antitoxin VapB
MAGAEAGRRADPCYIPLIGINPERAMTTAKRKAAKAAAAIPDQAKIFWTGRSQAVRLPKEFRFEGDAVRIRREGRRVVLEPIENDWAWIKQLSGRVDPDFEEAVNEDVPQQERPELDDLFK